MYALQDSMASLCPVVKGQEVIFLIHVFSASHHEMQYRLCLFIVISFLLLGKVFSLPTVELFKEVCLWTDSFQICIILSDTNSTTFFLKSISKVS